ncbi:MAG TPA: hypothetical protein PKA28_12505 [Methylomusa anaerophila]|uniref:hypothetical protein n=1 Tax=Methylomusa anaerophila TaxID=1930071 RepID=UPI0011AE1F4F|nr:hypothetical protein [Methylomusa anaerophila]HML89252.1 hypothetical protein [Methylomusa anaerophila]
MIVPKASFYLICKHTGWVLPVCFVVLHQGKIVEAGIHSELLRRQGYYWRLHQSGMLLHEEVG